AGRGPGGGRPRSANPGAPNPRDEPVTISSTPGGSMSEFDVYVGVDWATVTHQVCCLDPGGRILKQVQVPHSGGGLAMLVTELTSFGIAADRIAVAIERPDGAIVDGLLQHGFPVFAVNPKQLDRFRDRHTVAGAKDDRRDALVAGDAVRTHPAALRA